jgi:hypothetical protein
MLLLVSSFLFVVAVVLFVRSYRYWKKTKRVADTTNYRNYVSRNSDTIEQHYTEVKNTFKL